MTENTYCGGDQVDKSWFHFVQAWKEPRKQDHKERPEIAWTEDENGNVFGRYV